MRVVFLFSGQNLTDYSDIGNVSLQLSKPKQIEHKREAMFLFNNKLSHGRQAHSTSAGMSHCNPGSYFRP